jgi:hypothetical protein
MPPAAASLRVQDALQRTDCGWILEDIEETEREELLATIAREIEVFREEYDKRFGHRPNPFELLDEMGERAIAFFQSFIGPPLSLDIRIAIWRLLVGCEIRSLEIRYRKKDSFEVRIIVGQRHEPPDPDYVTSNPWDFIVLRHMGVMTVNGKLVLDGYYALTDAAT